MIYAAPQRSFGVNNDDGDLIANIIAQLTPYVRDTVSTALLASQNTPVNKPVVAPVAQPAPAPIPQVVQKQVQGVQGVQYDKTNTRTLAKDEPYNLSLIHI